MSEQRQLASLRDAARSLPADYSRPRLAQLLGGMLDLMERQQMQLERLQATIDGRSAIEMRTTQEGGT
jgi:hypothetical protein